MGSAKGERSQGGAALILAGRGVAMSPTLTHSQKQSSFALRELLNN
ncbi:MAG: hypothetical protein R2818_10390 [Flavobacteriales bacterium]